MQAAQIRACAGLTRLPGGYRFLCPTRSLLPHPWRHCRPEPNLSLAYSPTRCSGIKAPLHTPVASVSMSNSTTRVVEHVVLFKVKDGVPPEQAEAMVTGLRSLKSIESLIELSAGPALEVWSGSYTHALHCRYKDKDALAAYATHPFHLDVINKYIAPIVEDRLALDWEADLEEPRLENSYGAARIAVLKPKDDLPSEEVSSLIDMLKGYRDLFPLMKQVSVGKNFSPARAKGFEYGLLALFPSLQELEELTKNEEHVNLQYTKVRPLLENFAVIDYSTT